MRDALEFLRSALAAQAVVQRGPDGRHFLVAPPEYKWQEVALPPRPERIVQSRQFDDGDSLVAYARRFIDDRSLLLADINASTVSVIVDYPAAAECPETGTFSLAEHVACWHVAPSEEFRAWDNIAGRLLEQGEFLAHLEENAVDIIVPDPAAIMDLVRDFSALKSVTFRASRRLDNGDRRLDYATETQVKGGVEIPQRITLSIPLYGGEEPVEIAMMFRHRISDGGLALGVEWHRLESMRQAAFRSAVDRVASELGMPSLYGR